jgi:hypothetical protein
MVTEMGTLPIDWSDMRIVIIIHHTDGLITTLSFIFISLKSFNFIPFHYLSISIPHHSLSIPSPSVLLLLLHYVLKEEVGEEGRKGGEGMVEGGREGRGGRYRCWGHGCDLLRLSEGTNDRHAMPSPPHVTRIFKRHWTENR